jgi:DUF1009 family protein
MAKIGLVAGYGKISMLFADAAKKRGDTVIAFALEGITEKELEGHVDKIKWFKWGELHKAILFAATQGVRNIVLLGKVKKDVLFKGDDSLDDETKAMFKNTADRKDMSVLTNIANILAKVGIQIIDSTEYLKDLIPGKSVLTSREPSKDELNDIEYGRTIASQLAGLEIGQTVAVKDKTVVAIEAVEGTDDTIKRAGALSKIGFTVVKMARPKQDMRFDIPLVGLDTLKTLINAGGTALALEAGKTLLIDKDEMIALADQNNISIAII